MNVLKKETDERKTFVRDRGESVDPVSQSQFQDLGRWRSNMASKFASTVRCFNTTQNFEAAMLPATWTW